MESLRGDLAGVRAMKAGFEAYSLALLTSDSLLLLPVYG